jgi:membrane protein YdbS with pleckstrin-like domain
MRSTGIVKSRSDISPEELERIRRDLGGRPLTSRAKWLTISALWIMGCVAGLLAVLLLADGIWIAIGLTIVAFFFGEWLVHLPDTYGKYRREWELANQDEIDADEGLR